MENETKDFIRDLLDICDFLAGCVNRTAPAEAFIIAADRLAKNGVDVFSSSPDYERAKATIAANS